MTGVTGDMRGGRSVTGGACGSPGRRVPGVAGGGVGGKCSLARLACRARATRPGARGFDGLARPVVSGAVLLEEMEHALRIVGSLECQRPVILFVQPRHSGDRGDSPHC